MNHLDHHLSSIVARLKALEVHAIGHVVTSLFLINCLTPIGIPIAHAQAELEEVIVTATKREENKQDVPQALEVFSGERLAEMALANLSELSEHVPNLFIGDGLVTTNVNMRGMGSGGDRSFEQSVGMFIDGVYMPRNRQYRFPFFDVERVEILRGPQAVLFGLNSTAGAVSVVSRKNSPGDDLSGWVNVEYETEYQGTTVSGAIGGSLSETFAVRLAAQYIDSDGYYLNSFSGQDENGHEGTLVRLTAVWEPTEVLEITAKYENQDYDMFGNGGEIFTAGGAGLDWTRSVDASLLETYPTRVLQPGLFQDLETALVNINYDLGGHTLSATVGYSDTPFDYALDLDALPVPFVDSSVIETYEQTSIELRLASARGESFSYLVGAYYQDATLFNDNEGVFDLGTVLGPATCAALGLCGLGNYISGRYNQDSELFSVYASGTFNITPTFRITGGFRYTDDSKDLTRESDCDLTDLATGTIVVPGGGFVSCPASFQDQTRNSTNFMPEVIAQWDLADGDATIYVKVGTSAKGGGFAASTSVAPELLQYDDETVIAYEAGVKSRLAGGAAELNVSAFRNDFEDLQVNAFTVINGISQSAIQNAAKSTNQGFEIDGRWAVSEWFTFGASIGYLDAFYDDFPTSPCARELGLPGGSECDLGGRPMPYAPDLSGSIFADMSVPLGASINLVAGATVTYTDEYFTDGTLDSNGLQDSFSKIAVRIGLEDANEQWGISVIGKNLTDEAALNVTQPFFGYIGYIGAPRTITVQGFLRFGN